MQVVLRHSAGQLASSMIVKVRPHGAVRGPATGTTSSTRRAGRNRTEDPGSCSVDVHGCRSGVSCFPNAPPPARPSVPAWALGAGPSAPLLLEKAARRPPPSDCDPAAGGARAAASVRPAPGGHWIGLCAAAVRACFRRGRAQAHQSTPAAGSAPRPGSCLSRGKAAARSTARWWQADQARQLRISRSRQARGMGSLAERKQPQPRPVKPRSRPANATLHQPRRCLEAPLQYRHCATLSHWV